MRLVDVNVLIYAVNESDPRHGAARAWLDEALNGSEPVGFAWVVILAFLRLVTKVGLFPEPLPVRDAVAVIRAWLEQPPSIVIEPTSRHLDVLSGLLMTVGTGGNLTTDAHLAAIGVEHDSEIVTYDSDFGRFDGVRWTTPQAV